MATVLPTAQVGASIVVCESRDLGVRRPETAREAAELYLEKTIFRLNATNP